LPGEQLRPPVAGELLYGPPRFWTTFHDMLVDVYTVSVGPEKRAFQMALWLAIFNQARSLACSAAHADSYLLVLRLLPAQSGRSHHREFSLSHLVSCVTEK
jgi:hypothetical protein